MLCELIRVGDVKGKNNLYTWLRNQHNSQVGRMAYPSKCDMRYFLASKCCNLLISYHARILFLTSRIINVDLLLNPTFNLYKTCWAMPHRTRTTYIFRTPFKSKVVFCLLKVVYHLVFYLLPPNRAWYIQRSYIHREQWSSGHHCCCSFGRSRVRSRRPATLGRFSVVSLPTSRWIPGWCHYKLATASYLPPFLTLQFTYSSPSQNSVMTLAVEASINNQKNNIKNKKKTRKYEKNY